MYSSLSEATKYVRVILTFINSVLLLNGRNNGLWGNFPSSFPTGLLPAGEKRGKVRLPCKISSLQTDTSGVLFTC